MSTAASPVGRRGRIAVLGGRTGRDGRVEHAVRDTGEVALLHPRVPVGADPGEDGDRLAAQPRHPAPAAVAGDAHLLGRDPGAPAGEELSDLASVVHPHTLRVLAGTAA
jgi:hypothetical protein